MTEIQKRSAFRWYIGVITSVFVPALGYFLVASFNFFVWSKQENSKITTRQEELYRILEYTVNVLENVTTEDRWTEKDHIRSVDPIKEDIKMLEIKSETSSKDVSNILYRLKKVEEKVN